MSTSSERYEIVIGLEVHAQLSTQSKAYNTDRNSYGDEPNTNVGYITMALPGVLPKANTKVVDYAVRMGLACGSSITQYNYYDRKNYFYPDLPKGYQITQDKTPICRGGHIDIVLSSGEEKRINITRIHMEEDAGKSMHLPGAPESVIDLNRAGTPLIEIVSEPEMRTAEEAYQYLTEVRRLVRYLGICDGNMEEGSLRCDANISVRLYGEQALGKKVEVKNMNSFRNVMRAIEKEAERQIALVDGGQEVVSETRMFDGATGETHSLRSKESLNDYRYFPDPDLIPIIVDTAWIERVSASMPALPKQLLAELTGKMGLSSYDAGVLVEDREVAQYFLDITKYTSNYKSATNWVIGPIKAALNGQALTLETLDVSAKAIAETIALIEDNKMSFTGASQKLFPLLRGYSGSVKSLAEQHNLLMVSDDAGLIAIVDSVLARFADKVQAYRNGKTGLLGLFVGEVMKESKGKANPKDANRIVAEKLA